MAWPGFARLGLAWLVENESRPMFVFQFQLRFQLLSSSVAAKALPFAVFVVVVDVVVVA